MSYTLDWSNAEVEARLATILAAAFEALPPADKEARYQRIAKGEAQSGCIVRGDLDPETGEMTVDLDPETGALMVDWGGDLLVGIAPELLDPANQGPAASN
jgi:hypothetical protein